MEVSSHIPLDEDRDADPPLWRISFIKVVRSMRTLIDLAPLVGEQLSMESHEELKLKLILKLHSDSPQNELYNGIEVKPAA